MTDGNGQDFLELELGPVYLRLGSDNRPPLIEGSSGAPPKRGGTNGVPGKRRN